MSKRNLFQELMSGVKDLQKERAGKITLRRHKTRGHDLSDITPEEIKAIRHQNNLSQAVFADYLHINKRTLQGWEQGLKKPNRQATVLCKLVATDPGTLNKLKKLK